VAAERHGQWLNVAVTDDGPGLPPGQEEAVFEKFTRGERESAKPGVGLGLAICRAIIRLHNGEAWAETMPGGGTAFRFTLPIEAVPPMPQEPV
jgi:two-component system sensor histidine kinase KdpD